MRIEHFSDAAIFINTKQFGKYSVQVLIKSMPEYFRCLRVSLAQTIPCVQKMILLFPHAVLNPEVLSKILLHALVALFSDSYRLSYSDTWPSPRVYTTSLRFTGTALHATCVSVEKRLSGRRPHGRRDYKDTRQKIPHAAICLANQRTHTCALSRSRWAINLSQRLSQVIPVELEAFSQRTTMYLTGMPSSQFKDDRSNNIVRLKNSHAACISIPFDTVVSRYPNVQLDPIVVGL